MVAQDTVNEINSGEFFVTVNREFIHWRSSPGKSSVSRHSRRLRTILEAACAGDSSRPSKTKKASEPNTWLASSRRWVAPPESEKSANIPALRSVLAASRHSLRVKLALSK